jgi:hypothetical protein
MAHSQVLSSVEKLNRQRQLAAVARSHAHLMQLKIVVVCSCALAGAIGFGIYRNSPASSSSAPSESFAMASPASPSPDQLSVRQGPSTVQIGQVQLPHEGETCRQFKFDNATGVLGDETLGSCSQISVRPPEGGAARVQAIMNAFRINK